MGLFKKKYEKNVSRDNEFLKNYAVKVNGLLLYAENNEAVTAELNALRDDFQYSVASASSEAKSVEKKIEKEYENLEGMITQPEWDEKLVLLSIKNVRRLIVDVTSIR